MEFRDSQKKRRGSIQKFQRISKVSCLVNEFNVSEACWSSCMYNDSIHCMQTGDLFSTGKVLTTCPCHEMHCACAV